MASRQPGEWNAALLGASTLKGKEVKAVLEERSLPLRRLLLLDTEDVQGQLTDFDGEPAIVQPVGAETFQGIQLAIFAASESFTQEHWRQAQQSGCRIIDLSYFLESEPNARLQAPLLMPPGETAESGDGGRMESAAMAVSAHPMSIALQGILALLSRRSVVVRAAATIFEPASEHGQTGVEELHRQTISLLAFQEIPKKIFDAQLSFNLLARNGEQSRPTLQERQQRIAHHLRTLSGGRTVQPALRLLQAPLYHGYSFTCWVELAQPVEAEVLEAVLDQRPFSVCREDQPSVISAAASNDILLGSVEPDPAHEAAYWIWGAFDNLRIAALNATRIAEEMMGVASGTIPAESGRPSVRL